MGRIIFLVIFCYCTCCVNATNDGLTAGGRSAALGGTSVSLNGFWSTFNNQAGIVFFNQESLGFAVQVGINKDPFRLCRERDIGADNTILSTYIADARIAYNGSGPINAASDPGIKTRLGRSLALPSRRYRFPRLACSRSNDTNSALKFPIPKPREPWRSITS